MKLLNYIYKLTEYHANNQITSKPDLLSVLSQICGALEFGIFDLIMTGTAERTRRNIKPH